MNRSWERVTVRHTHPDDPLPRCPRCAALTQAAELWVRSSMTMAEYQSGGRFENHGESRVRLEPCGHIFEAGELTFDVGSAPALPEGQRALEEGRTDELER